jgi:rubredoxin
VPDDEQETQDRQEADDTISDAKKCPECGEPIENVRATCPNCGYEYQDSDYDQPDAGAEFNAGTEVDDQGNEQVDESGKVESERQEGS